MPHVRSKEEGSCLQAHCPARKLREKCPWSLFVEGLMETDKNWERIKQRERGRELCKGL